MNLIINNGKSESEVSFIHNNYFDNAIDSHSHVIELRVSGIQVLENPIALSLKPRQSSFSETLT